MAALATELLALIGAITPIFLSVRKVQAGNLCLLRSEMLNIYYHNREKKVIRQYEYENFIALHAAYKAQHGNSFIDKIRKEVDEWEVVT
jgi:hypothetical protein